MSGKSKIVSKGKLLMTDSNLAPLSKPWAYLHHGFYTLPVHTMITTLVTMWIGWFYLYVFIKDIFPVSWKVSLTPPKFWQNKSQHCLIYFLHNYFSFFSKIKYVNYFRVGMTCPPFLGSDISSVYIGKHGTIYLLQIFFFTLLWTEL